MNLTQRGRSVRVRTAGTGRSCRPRLEVLEERTLLATFTVNSIGDGGDALPGDGTCQTALGGAVECTLRAAIEESNASPAVFDNIHFNIPGAGPHQIQPASALPTITDPVNIDGYTEPGSSPNTLPIDFGTNATIIIEVNGGLITDGSSGLVLQSSGNLVRGLSITGFGYSDVGDPGSAEHIPVGGIVLLGGNNQIGGNFIGVDPDGATADANNFYGVFVKSSDNRIGGPQSSARNLISGNQGFGIQLTSGGLPGGSGFTPAENNRIQGNLIGTDRTGTVAVPNSGGGVMLRLHARNNLIGGNHNANNEVRNIISGNGGPFTPFGDPGGPYQDWPDAPYPVSGGHGDGIHIGNLTSFTPNEPVPNTIQGNFVGTTASGMAALPNKHGGIVLAFTNSVTIGGPRSPIGGCNALCNLVSANGEHGVAIASTFNRDIVVQGNFIGTDRTGAGPLGNTADGVFMFIASDSLVGGNTPNLGNLIAFNRSGVVVKGTPVIPNPGRNTIRLNSIHSNRLLGIDLLAPGTGAESDGPTLNDLGDADAGPNQLQNFPVIASAQFGAATHVAGTLNSRPSARYVLDFYASTAADPSGFGEGQRWIGTTTVTTNGAGNASFNLFLPGGSLPGEWITATATRLTATGLPTDTSEFSAARRLSTGIVLDHCTLYVHGTEGNDRLTVTRSGNEIRVMASFVPPNAPVTTFDASLIDTIDLVARGGNDTISTDITYPPTPIAPAPPCTGRTRIAIDAGQDADKVAVRITNAGPATAEVEVDVGGGAGNDVIDVNARMGIEPTPFQPILVTRLSVNGGADNDQVSLNLGAISAPAARSMPALAAMLNVDLGSGNDSLRSRVTDLVLSDSSFDALGGDGMDVMDLIYDGATFDEFAQKVRGGDGADDIAVTWRNVDVLQKVQPAATPDLFIDGEGGDDSIRVRSTELEARTDWSGMVFGGDGDDQILYFRIDELYYFDHVLLIDGGFGDDRLSYGTLRFRALKAGGDLSEHLRGGFGDDTISIRRNIEVVGQAAVLIEGNEGDDVIEVLSTRREAAGTDEQIVDGGEGNDQIAASFTRNTAENLTFGAIGGDGDDHIQLVDTSGDYDSPGISVDGGQGTDDIELSLIGTDYRDLSIGVIGGDGDDGLHLTQVPPPPPKFNAPGPERTVTLVGGNGNDTIDVEFGGVLVPPDGTDDVFIQGGDGRDTINHVAADWVVSGAATVHIDGDAEDDTINVSLNNVLLSGGTLNLDVNGANDNDTIAVVVQFQPISIGIFNGLVEGQDGDDTLLFNLFAPASVLLIPVPKLDGGNNFDTCVATANVLVVNCEA